MSGDKGVLLDGFRWPYIHIVFINLAYIIINIYGALAIGKEQFDDKYGLTFSG